MASDRMMDGPSAIDVEVTAPVYPTELPERVEGAITALFPEAEVEHREGEVVGRAATLDRFAERLREQAIVDAAREVMLAGVEGGAFSVRLKKQTATEGVVNFAVGGPAELGDLHVRVRVDTTPVEAVIDELAPPTDPEP